MDNVMTEGVVETKIVHACVIGPTHGLRWNEVLPGQRVLEQMWYCSYCGKREWKPVPEAEVAG